MEMISPVTAEACSPYIGRPVCAVLHDGSRYYGYLHSVEGGQLRLRSEQDAAVTSMKKKKRHAPEASTKAFYPFSPFGYQRGTIALDLALIALLFAIPFFW